LFSNHLPITDNQNGIRRSGQDRGGYFPGEETMTGTGTQQEIVIGVGKMMCAHCAKRVETALGRLPGVLQATVTLEKKQVAVVFDPSRTSPEEMEKAITGAGYQFLGIVTGA
jgi:copper ion binding protein